MISPAGPWVELRCLARYPARRFLRLMVAEAAA